MATLLLCHALASPDSTSVLSTDAESDFDCPCSGCLSQKLVALWISDLVCAETDAQNIRLTRSITQNAFFGAICVMLYHGTFKDIEAFRLKLISENTS